MSTKYFVHDALLHFESQSSLINIHENFYTNSIFELFAYYNKKCIYYYNEKIGKKTAYHAGKEVNKKKYTTK